MPAAGGGYPLAPKIERIQLVLELQSGSLPCVTKEANDRMGIKAAADATLPSQASALLSALGIDEATLKASDHGLWQKAAAIKRLLGLKSNTVPGILSEASNFMGPKPAADATLPTQVSALLSEIGIDEVTLERKEAPEDWELSCF